jgi:hypothetical protein
MLAVAKYPQVKVLFQNALQDLDRAERAELRHRLEGEAGVSNATVSRWINGETRESPSVPTGNGRYAGALLVGTTGLEPGTSTVS